MSSLNMSDRPKLHLDALFLSTKSSLETQHVTTASSRQESTTPSHRDCHICKASSKITPPCSKNRSYRDNRMVQSNGASCMSEFAIVMQNFHKPCLLLQKLGISSPHVTLTTSLLSRLAKANLSLKGQYPASETAFMKSTQYSDVDKPMQTARASHECSVHHVVCHGSHFIFFRKPLKFLILKKEK